MADELDRYGWLVVADRRAAEERLRARYEAEAMRVVDVPSHCGPDYQPIWPTSDGRVRWTEVEPTLGIFVEQIQLDGSYPDTQLTIVFRFHRLPECRFVIYLRVWGLEALGRPEPPYNDVFWVNFAELLAACFRSERYAACGDELIEVDRPGSWAQELPRIAYGDIDLGPDLRRQALRAMKSLALGYDELGSQAP
jgi:hypothetical protein